MKYFNHYVSMIKDGVMNLVRWFSVIWFDRDNKENYIYVILLKKIDNKIEYFQKESDCDKRSEDLEKQLASVRSALVRLIDDDYYGEACAFYGLKLDLNYNNVGILKSDIAKVFRLEKELRHQDMEAIFTEDVSSKIHGWWD